MHVVSLILSIFPYIKFCIKLNHYNLNKFCAVIGNEQNNC